MGPNSAPFPCSVASSGSRIDHELLFRSEDAYSVVRVINKNMGFKNFVNSVKGSIIMTFIIPNLFCFLFTLISCSMAFSF